MERTYSFAEFKVDAVKRLLLKNAQTIALNSKTFDLLVVLVENRGQIVSKDELLDKVWEGQFVEENNLTVQISALRKIFGEKKDEHQFIVTVPGKGYKFVAGEISPSQTSLAAANQFSKPAAKIFNDGEAIIGRAAEIAEIKNILREQNKCLLTLTGAGGSGKTKLARTIADELQTEFTDGVYFVELASVTQAELMVGAIAQVLDVEEVSGKSLLAALKIFLRERSVLIVLDNFEQLLSAAPVLKEIFDYAVNLKILVTSRTLLHLKFEQEKMVSPLAVPPNSNLSAEELTAYSSIELFAVRARAARPNFALSAENASIIAKICHKLDGLPLAIELAAVRVKLLSPQAIWERLENSLNLLTGGAKDLPIRQRTMRGAIEWSYELLEAEEKVLFRRLAIFAGGFTAEAAESAVSRQLSAAENELHITGNERLTHDVFNLLDSLIDNNLLTCKEQTDGNVRLGMLEVVREFALELLQTSGEIDDLQRIHAHYFLSLAEEAEPHLQNETGREWLETLENEHDNFRAALGWSLKNDSYTAARIAAALRYFWLTHSHLREGFGWCEAALQTTENSISEARLKLLMATGLFLKRQDDFEAARKFYEKGLAESREANDAAHIGKAYHGLAAVAVLQRDYAAGRKFLEEALALSREMGNELHLAYSLGSLGDLEMCQGNVSAARPLLEESLTLSKKSGDQRLLTVAYCNLGVVDYQENFYEAAAFNFTESLRLAGEMDNKIMISIALEGVAALAATAGNHEHSAKLAGAAENLREKIGFRLDPTEAALREKYLAENRASLKPGDFALAYQTGRALDFSESMALSKVTTFDFSNVSERESTEIIIETHSISQIITEEEIEN